MQALVGHKSKWLWALAALTVLAGLPPEASAEAAPAGEAPKATPADSAPAEAKPAEAKPADEAPHELTLEETVQLRLKEAQANETLAEDDKKTILDRYNQAISALKEAESFAAKAAQFQQEAEGAPAEIEQLQEAIETPPEAVEVGLPAQASVAELEQELKKLETDLAAQADTVEALEARLKGSAERKAALPDLITAARQQLADADKQLADLPKAEAAAPATAGQELLLKARQRALAAEIKALEAELQHFDTLAALWTARRDVAVRRKSQVAKRHDLLRKELQWRRLNEAEQDHRTAEQDLAAAEGLHPALEQMAADNLALTAQRIGADSLRVKRTRAEAELQRLAGLTERTRNDFREVKADVAVAGLTEKMGRVLRRWQQRLRNRRAQVQQGRTRKGELAEVLLSLSDLRRRQDDLKDLDARVDALASSLDRALGEDRIQTVVATARDLLVFRKQILAKLISDHGAYSSGLIELNLKEQELADVSRAFADYIDERVLWVRSAGWIGSPETLPPGAPADATPPSWWSGLGRAAAWFVSPEGWATGLRALGRDLTANWILYVLAAALIAAMAVTRRRAHAALNALGDQVVSIRTDSFKHTLKALGLTAWLALLGPLVLGFPGWRLMAANAGASARAFGLGLLAAANLYLLIEMTRALCLEGGLGHRHFHWHVQILRLLRSRVFYPMLALLPVAFVVVALEAHGDDAFRNALGRLVFLAGVLFLGVLLMRILRPPGELIRLFLSRRKGGWLDRLRYVWYPLVVAVPFALAVGVAAGYYYTAVELTQRLVVTLWLGLGVAVVYGLVMRGLFMARRRLAVQLAEQRRQAAEQGTDGEPPDPSVAPPRAEEEVTSLVAINEQTRRLVATLTAVGLVVGLWLIWADVLPALRILKEHTLYTYADGTALTLADLGLAILAAVATVVAGKNIPGLMEVAVLQNLPLTAGIRFAITTISRYVITVVGLIVTFALVGIGWAKVQWLAAAVTVSLGFGLQEFFANFISRLTILFERPIRVGDVVTVGDTTGTVTRIRVRATTITDWDRKELIVPNKEFVTGRVMNWSLSDNLLRLTLPVGIAYGSDTTTAKQLMLKCAQESPYVLDEPPPSAYFDEFGDSALVFKLRFYIGGVTHWLVAQDELCRTIDEAFREAGIEIAFPQMDIHVRMAPPGAPGPADPAAGDAKPQF